jgi:hypothetical protein
MARLARYFSAWKRSETGADTRSPYEDRQNAVIVVL